MKKLLFFFFHLPQTIIPNLYSLPHWQYFMIREIFHFMGGCIIGAIGSLIEHFIPSGWVHGSFFGLLMFVMGKLESDDERSGQSRFKTFVDLVMWAAGYSLSFALIN